MPLFFRSDRHGILVVTYCTVLPVIGTVPATTYCNANLKYVYRTLLIQYRGFYFRTTNIPTGLRSQDDLLTALFERGAHLVCFALFVGRSRLLALTCCMHWQCCSDTVKGGDTVIMWIDNSIERWYQLKQATTALDYHDEIFDMHVLKEKTIYHSCALLLYF